MQEKSIKTKIDLNGKTVLVTGAAGFIGSFLSERLLSDFEDIRVIGFDSVNDYYDIRLKESRLKKLQKHENFIFIKANLADKDKVNEVFCKYSPQIVVNLAAQAGVRYSITNPDAYIESNIIGFYNILEACRHSYDDGATPVEHLVYASSSSVYGSNKKVPYNTDDKVYHLEIPNKEIRSSLYQSLLPYYFGKDTQSGNTQIAKMSALINKGNMDGALRLLRDFLSTVPYCDNTAYEGHYQQMLYVIFTILTNYRMQVEVRTHKGRIDVALETESRIYVMEIKFNGSADDALRQIDLKGYADAYKNSLKQIVKVGINFCVKGDANFTDWIIKQ